MLKLIDLGDQVRPVHTERPGDGLDLTALPAALGELQQRHHESVPSRIRARLYCTRKSA